MRKLKDRKEKSAFRLRMAQESDAREILDIYAYYIKNTAVSFDYDVPTIQEFTEKIKSIKKRYPYLVVEEEGKVVGYAYAACFKEREAYDWAVETTIYMHPDCKGKGYGKSLYSKLEELLKKQNIQNMNACIACIDQEDEYLTNASPQFHEHVGFRLVGKFNKCGCKFGRWYDMIWMEKIIGDHGENPSVVIPITEITKEEIWF